VLPARGGGFVERLAHHAREIPGGERLLEVRDPGLERAVAGDRFVG
jgi:hypothetical protein